MRFLIRAVVLSCIMLSCIGCASRGFDRGALAERLRGAPVQVDDELIRKALELEPQLSLPAKVGVFFRPGRFDAKDRDSVLAAAEELKAGGVVSDMFVISGAVVTDDSLKGVRLAAARYGADAVLVISGDYDIDSYSNPSSVLYLTLVGMWVIPGSHRDALFMVNGALFDVRNGYLYLTSESEGVGRSIGPYALIKLETAIRKAREEAVEGFVRDFVRRMKSLKGITEE